MNNNSISIYIHWPYCLSKCPYCDFNSHVASTIDHNIWLEAYKKQLDNFKTYIQGKYIRSIFFGGGTPSLMEPKVVFAIIDRISSLSTIDEHTEITLEANPTSFEVEKFNNFKAAGINRVSIGVQSLVAKDLIKLGRNHNADQAKNALIQASRIFDRISFDLIYARESQSLANWQEELKSAMDYAKGHISLYQLTIEKGTPFYKLFHDGSLVIPIAEVAADMYEWTNIYLASFGYNKYEISNYAYNGFESKHNLAYWKYDSYLGIGPGAHSRVHFDDTIKAMMMHYKPDKWLNLVMNGNNQDAIQTSSDLNIQEVIEEIFMMGLRLKEGVQNKKLQILTGNNIEQVVDIKTANIYEAAGLLSFTKDNIKLSDKGLMMHNYIVPRLLKN